MRRHTAALITTVVDFSAHSHQDKSNMIGGCTAILTLTRPENRVGEMHDEQYHCLPLYMPKATPDQLRTLEEAGGIQRLTEFKKKVHVVRLPDETRDSPLR